MEHIPDDSVLLIKQYNATGFKPAEISGKMLWTAEGSGAGPVSFCGTEMMLQQLQRLRRLNEKQNE